MANFTNGASFAMRIRCHHPLGSSP